jgi:peroxiredoxin
VMKERISNLREAIIKSAEVKVGDQTVAEIAQDELYKINHLAKGRQAPDIQGVDSSARPMSLQQFRGKVVMLVFWSSWDANAGKMLEVLRNSSSKHAGKPWVLLGVNRDSLNNLRALEADALVTWRNFSDAQQKIFNDYRVTSSPYCLVLDQKGIIKYRGNIGAFADAVSNELLSLNNGTTPLGQ